MERFDFEYSESLTAIAPALITLQESIRAVELSGFNDFDKYSYLKEEDLIFKLRPLLAESDLSFLKTLVSVEDLPQRETSKGKPIYPVRVVLCGMLLHKSGEWIKFYSTGDGQDGGDKGGYKALTGASKYLIAKGFGFPTGDDPEASDSEEAGEPGKKPAQKKKTEQKRKPAPKQTGGGKPAKGYQTFLDTMAAHEKRLGPDKYREILTENNIEFASEIAEDNMAAQKAIHIALKGVEA